MTRRMRFTFLGTRRSLTSFTRLSGTAWGDLTDLYWTVSAEMGSATWTAPPTSKAPPAAVADNFARAIRTDMSFSLSLLPENTAGLLTRHFLYRTNNADRHANGNRVNPESAAHLPFFQMEVGGGSEAVPKWNRTGREYEAFVNFLRRTARLAAEAPAQQAEG